MKMRREELVKMKSGRSMDILVAEQVMGWQIETEQLKLHRLDSILASGPDRTWWREPQGGWHCDPMPYSTDIRAAWKVVRNLIDRGQTLYLLQSAEENRAAFRQPGEAGSDYFDDSDISVAICKAALAHVGSLPS